MRRVAIVGNTAGGKSTLGRKLAQLHGLTYHSVDQIQWRPGWVAAPEPEVRLHLDRITAGDRWVVDGWGPRASMERRLEAADTIIFVDLPLWVHFWLAAERQMAAARGEGRVDPIEGCNDLEITRRIFEGIWQIDQHLKPDLIQLLERYKSQRDYRHITSLEALDALAG